MKTPEAFIERLYKETIRGYVEEVSGVMVSGSHAEINGSYYFNVNYYFETNKVITLYESELIERSIDNYCDVLFNFTSMSAVDPYRSINHNGSYLNRISLSIPVYLFDTYINYMKLKNEHKLLNNVFSFSTA